MIKNIRKLTILLSTLLSLTLVLGFKVGDQVELDNYLNGRTSPNFLKDTNNIKSKLDIGTQGKVLEAKKLNSENYGIKMEVTNGRHAGQSYWVHYNRRQLALHLITGETMAETENMIVDARMDCGPVRVEIAHTAVTDLVHFRGRAPDEFYRDRIELRFTPISETGVRDIMVTQPVPPSYFFSLLRENAQGELIDLTETQIDAPHTGRPEAEVVTLSKLGQTKILRLSYAIISVIAPEDRLVPGRYVLRMSPYKLMAIDEAHCAFKGADMRIEVLETLKE
jgi:hypothetical protein